MHHNYDTYKDWFENDQRQAELNHLEDFETLSKIKHYSSFLTSASFDVNENFSKIKSKQTPEKAKQYWFKIAAILLISLSIGFTSFYLSSNEISTHFASTQSLELPDASVVTLAANSNLKFNNLQWKFSRKVNLEGEAFFKVEKGSSFKVTTNLGEVEVLGTEFNVKQLKDEFNVTCYEGSVKVSYNEQEQVIKAEEIAILKNGKLSKRSIKLLKQPLWISNETGFEAASFSDIAKRINQFYGINISLESKTDKRFTGVLPTDNLEKVFTILSKVYRIKPKKIDDKSYIFVVNYEEF